MCTVCRFPCADLFACIHVSRKSHVSHGGSGRRTVEELRREVYLITFDKMGWRFGRGQQAPEGRGGGGRVGVVRRCATLHIEYLGPGGEPEKSLFSKRSSPHTPSVLVGEVWQRRRAP